MQDFPEIVDNSLLKAFRSCPRKGQLEYLEHWKPSGKSIHLHAGACFASGLETARKAFYEQRLSVEAALGHGLERILRDWGEPDIPLERQKTKTLDRILGALDYYFAQYPLETDHLTPLSLSPGGKPLIECQFLVPLPIKHPSTGKPLLYTGRFDLIASWAGHGRFGVDEKTTTQLGASWIEQWDLDPQFTGYAWAQRESRFPLDGFVIRGVSLLKEKYETQQVITYRANWQLDEWLENTVALITAIISQWDSERFPKNWGSCGNYGGCMFRQICNKQTPSEWLPAYFTQRRWNPITRQEEAL